MSHHVGRTGVDGMLRVLSVSAPLRHDVPPSAIALMRDPVADTVDRLSAVVNNVVHFEHAVAVYRLRALVVTINGPRRGVLVDGGLAVSLAVGGARHGALSVVVVGDMDVRMAMVTQCRHQYWCWHLMGLLDVSWGPPTENHHAPVQVAAGDDYRVLAQALARRSQVPHCASLPWHRVECGMPGPCYIQGGEVLTRRPDDARGVIVRGGCRVQACRAVRHLAELMGADRVLVVAPSPVLRQWWKAALPEDTFVCRVAHDMLEAGRVSEAWPVVVFDAVQPFPINCAAMRPTIHFSVVLARTHTGVHATRAEHALCRLVGLGAAQVQGLLVPPASCVVHRGDASAVGVTAVHAHDVALPDDLRSLVEQLGRPDVHCGVVVDNTPCVAANPRRQSAMFGSLIADQDAAPDDAALTCPMCEIEDCCGAWPVLKLVGCAHAVCLRHLRLWPHQCSVCRAPIQHQAEHMPVICRTGSLVETSGAKGNVVLPLSVRHQLQSAVARYWAGATNLTPKLARCVDDAVNRYHQANGAVMFVAAHDAAVVHVADAIRQRGVPVKMWLGVSDAVPGGDDNRFVLCLAQRMVCCEARLAWVMPWAEDAVPHAVCASSTVPVLSLVRMLGGCRQGGTVTYVAYRDTPEAQDLQNRVADFRHACPEVQVHGEVAVV